MVRSGASTGSCWAGARLLRRSEPVERRPKRESPAPFDRSLGGAEPASGFLYREPLREGEECVGDVRFVTAQKSGIDAAADVSNDELPHRAAGAEFLGPGIEIGEGP